MPKTRTARLISLSDSDGLHLSRRRLLTAWATVFAAGSLVPFFRLARQGALTSIRTSRPMLGTWVQVIVRSRDRGRAERATRAAFAAFADVDRRMSIHRADSELARVNADAGRRVRPVSSAVLAVVERSLELSRQSGGIYDPTVLPLMHLYGFYGPARDRFPTDREIAACLERTGSSKVTLDRAAGTLGLASAGAGLDLGSLGKGWAVDRAVDALRAHGITSGLVDAGGKVYGLGVPEEGVEGWSVGLRHPVSGRLERVFVLRNQAVGTSGNNERYRDIGGVRVGHLLDARRGRPTNEHLTASVQAATCLEADALCTVAFLLGPDRFRHFPGALLTHYLG